MKLSYKISFFAVLVLGLAYMEAMASSCTGSNAVVHSEADCLAGEFDNTAFNSNGTRYSIKKTCTYGGTVGVRVDMESGSDVFMSTNSSGWTTTATDGQQTSEIYCCLDREGGFCDGLSDHLTDAYCNTEFSSSPAITSLSSSCTVSSATADLTDEECDLSASCSYTDTNNRTRSITSNLSISWTRVRADVYACNGTLQDGSSCETPGFGE